MQIVAKIDDIMAMTLTNINIGGEISSQPLLYHRRQNVFDDVQLITKWKEEGM